MNLKEVREMIDLMNQNGLAELELERDGNKLKLKKAADNVLAAPVVSYGLPTIPAVPRAVEPAPAAAPAVAASGENKSHLLEIKSPMVGTFYRASSPEAAPFVEIGHSVEVGKVVSIIEAMKLMNEIKSEVKGKIVEICVDNAEPVEFGQVLFRVDPSK